MEESNTSAIAVDPVCGMALDPTSATDEVDYKGERYYFCSLHCARAFWDVPEKDASLR